MVEWFLKRQWNRFPLHLLQFLDIQLSTEGRFYSKTRMWHDNTQLKNFLWLHIVILNCFIYSKLRHVRLYMVGKFQSHLVRTGSKRFLLIWWEKNFPSFKLFTCDTQEKSWLPVLQYPTWLLKKYTRLQHYLDSRHL